MNRDPPNVVQLVLAAGLSRRMGTSKPLLDFDGRTALQLVVEAGQRGGCTESVVVVGHAADEIRRAHRFSEDRVQWVVNDEPGGPQLRSLQLALEAASPVATGFCVHPVDYPLATHEEYRLLLDAFVDDDEEDHPHTVYILSHEQRRGHPILCPASVAAKLLALGPDQTARDVINHESIQYVTTDNAGVTRDMDTPEDYAELLEIYRRFAARSE